MDHWTLTGSKLKASSQHHLCHLPMDWVRSLHNQQQWPGSSLHLREVCHIMRQYPILVFGAILGGHLWICMHYMDPGDHDFCKSKRLLYTNARIFTPLRATLDAGPRPIEHGPNLKHKLDPRRQIGPRSRISWLIGKMFQIKLGNSRNVENCLLGFSLYSQSIGPMFTSQWSSETRAKLFWSRPRQKLASNATQVPQS